MKITYVASDINCVSVAATIADLHQWGDGEHFNVIGKTYAVETKGHLYKLKWVWDRQCRCISEQTGIVGNSRHCVGHDYFTQAGRRGLFTQEQFCQLGY